MALLKRIQTQVEELQLDRAAEFEKLESLKAKLLEQFEQNVNGNGQYEQRTAAAASAQAYAKIIEVQMQLELVVDQPGRYCPKCGDRRLDGPQ